MKKYFAVLFIAMVAAASLFAASAVLEYHPYENGIEIENSNKKGIICNDNIRIINDSVYDLDFEVYGKTRDNAEYIPISYVEVEKNGADSEKCDPRLKNFKYVYVACDDDMDIEISKIVCERNDMYIYISYAEPKKAEAPASSGTASDGGSGRTVIGGKALSDYDTGYLQGYNDAMLGKQNAVQNKLKW